MRAPLFPRRHVCGTCCARRGWLLWLLILLAAPCLHADIQEPTGSRGRGAREQRREGPADGVPQKATIDQGASVEITLRSRGQIGKWIEFSIRSQPEHGSLAGPPRQLTRDSAVVTYVHHAGDGPGNDTFTYSVQAAGSAVSAPATVAIEIRDTPPSVVATPAELDFGTVKVGDTSGADLVLENQGGGEAMGRLNVPSPWYVDGDAGYRLGRGERQTFHVLFGPRSGRSYSETIPLATDTGAQTHLLGTGLGLPGSPDSLVSTGTASRANAAASPGGTLAAAGMEPAEAAAAARAAAKAAAKPASPNVAPTKGNGNTDPLADLNVPPDPTAEQSDYVPLDNSGYVTFYDTGLKQLKLRGLSRTTLDISWKPLAPAPKSYRIELRYLAVDSEHKLRIDWRPYAQVDIRPGKDLCTATVRGLTPHTLQTLRVVALDYSGRIAGGSATLQARTLPGSTFWRVTPLRVLAALFLLCAALAVRRRWQIHQMFRELDASRAASREISYRS